MEGQIIKALSGFYYCSYKDRVYQCRGRGNFRKRKIMPLVGDHVVFQADNLTDGYILEIKPRKNKLVRPPIANVDIVILTFSAVEPLFSTHLVDRFLVAIEKENIEPIIVLSKMDLAGSKEKEAVLRAKMVYEQIGYTVFLMPDEQIQERLKKEISGKTAVISGQTGVGKSTLLNRLNPKLKLSTSEISSALGRGKHTTRHVELMHIGGGFIADTPGFSSIEWAGELLPEQLQFCFPEIEYERRNCKFSSCLHKDEPGCAVKFAVTTNKIAAFRYEHYLQILTEIKNRKPRY